MSSLSLDSQRVLFRRGVVRVKCGRQERWDWRLWRRGRGVLWGLVLEVVVMVMMVVNGRAIVRDDRRRGREDVRSVGRSGRGRVAPRHAGVRRGPPSKAESRGGWSGQAVGKGLIVEEVGTLVDEALDDCLVGACGGQSVHRGEVRSHQSGPKTDGQILTRHQVQLAVLAHPEAKKELTQWYHEPYLNQCHHNCIAVVLLLLLKQCNPQWTSWE